MWEIFNELLQRKGIKAIDVSRATGIDPSTFSDWKKGKSKPKVDKMQKIAEYFGVSVDFLMGNTDGTIPHAFSMSPEERLLEKFRQEIKEIEDLYSMLDDSDKNKAKDFMRFLLVDKKYNKSGGENGQ